MSLSPALSLEEQRNALIHFVESRRPQGSLKNRITIVFDGREDMFGFAGTQTVQVVFSQGESADQKIKSMLEHSRRPKSVIVVTDDREIQVYAKRLQATVSSVRQFLSAKERFSKSRKQDKDLSHGDIKQINDEFEQIWLKDD